MDEIKNTYLTFTVGSSNFGIHVEHVVEIIEYEEPKTQSSQLPFMKGLIDHRGGIVPLIDAGLKFGMEPVDINDQACCIVMSVKGADQVFDIALAVDDVTEVVEVDDDKKQYIETNYKPGYVQFAAKVDDNYIMFIDVNKVFNDTEVISLMKIMGK
ncbi:MAG: chemotaxis protein CheW [Bacteroidales bacterium]|nr:chemotaxis protein CheW [Bacteroidales bacterium]